MKYRFRTLAGFAVGALLLMIVSLSPAIAGQMPADAREWIQRMNKAVVEGNYEGVFQVRSGQWSQELRIIHRFKDGEMIERVVATDGSGYEQKRKGDQWWDVRPRSRMVTVATRTRSFGYLQALNGLDDSAARHYDIRDAGRSRLLGRDVQMIRLEPKDELRFGYRFWLDVGSALPLKLQRVTHDGKVVKEIAFSFINAPLLPSDISEEQLKVQADFKDFKHFDHDKDKPMVNAALKRSLVVQPALMPAGYRVRVFGPPMPPRQSAPGKPAVPRARFIISDGVSWADVFLAPQDEPVPAGGRTDGQYSTYQLTLDGVSVVVVGEIPLAAAKAIAQAFRPE